MSEKINNLDHLPLRPLDGISDSLTAPAGRSTGLVVIRGEDTNINGDPDDMGAPRLRADSYPEATDVSFFRKFRELLINKDLYSDLLSERLMPMFEMTKEQFTNYMSRVNIIEQKDMKPTLEHIQKLAKNDLKAARKDLFSRFWDARLRGITAVTGSGKSDDSGKEDKNGNKKGDLGAIASAGPLTVGNGLGHRPADVARLTTSQAVGHGDKEHGLAPAGKKYVVGTVYYFFPIHVNPFQALQTGAMKVDIELFKTLAKTVYRDTASSGRVADTQAIFWRDWNGPDADREIDLINHWKKSFLAGEKPNEESDLWYGSVVTDANADSEIAGRVPVVA